MSNYAKTAIKYALVMEAGKAVSALVDKGTLKEEIDYAKVRDYWDVGKSVLQCYAIKDASGALHAAEVELKNNGSTAVVPFKYKKKSSEAPDSTPAYSKVGYLVFE